MGSRRKIPASASREAQGESSKSLIDRFSDLPDQIAHHVLSFLIIKDLTRFGCVSKKCRELYLSSPSLNVNLIPYPKSMKKRMKVLNGLERFFFQRGNNTILQLRVTWESYFEKSRVWDEQYRIFSWIQNAVRCNVEVIDLTLCVYGELPLPSCIFRCPSLRSLSLNLYPKFLQAPSLSFSCNLQYLKVVMTRIADKRFFKWISHCCKCLKTLYIGEVHDMKNITIASSSLESVTLVCSSFRNLEISGEKIEDISLQNLSEHSNGRSSVRIYAPDLKSFKWSGKLVDCHLGKLMFLEKAKIYLSPVGNKADKLLELLSCIQRVKALILNEETAKALFKESLMPLPLDICLLGMHIKSLNDNLVPLMVSFLKRLTSLNTFSLRIGSKPSSMFSSPTEEESASGFNMGYWKIQELEFISELKEVTIELSDGTNELELARYFLEHAENLQKVVIIYPPHQSKSVRKISKKMVSAATLVLQKWQKAGIRKQG